MIELRRKLRKQREQEVYRQREAKRAIVEFFLIVMLIMLVGGFLMFLGYMFFLR